MMTQLDDRTEARIEAHKRGQVGRRAVATQLLREMGVDVQTDAELDLVMREWGKAGRGDE